ncbi:hypothetical protein VE02_04282 [Pseudogymnoascus sp. 03VT05]|nr:hypothetical protein VE02_04282 [Pseudogymnoascus sp. 03VT05]
MPISTANPADPSSPTTPILAPEKAYVDILTPQIAYLDIMCAALGHRKPMFASTYSYTLSSSSPYSIGLQLYNGCDDRVLYTISHISSTIEFSHDLDADQLSHSAQAFNDSLQNTIIPPAQPRTSSQIKAGAAFADGEILITVAFRLAARIYALGVLGRYARRSDSIRPLMLDLARTLTLLSKANCPCQQPGLLWMYLVGGAASLPGDAFRVALPASMEREKDGRFRAVVMKFMGVWEGYDDTRAWGNGWA